MRNLVLLPALAAALFAVNAAAQQTTTPSTAATTENGGTPAPTPTKAAKPRKICREDESANSRMPTRECHTQAEWDAIAARQRGNRDTGARTN